MYPIIIVGSGHMGISIAHFLAQHTDYYIYLWDKMPCSEVILTGSSEKIKYFEIDIENENSVNHFFVDHSALAIIACIPFFKTVEVANIALRHGLHYFDLTESILVNEIIATLAATSEKAFVPNCGVAPGFITIAAKEIMEKFDTVVDVKLRCGALPQFSDNALHYALTWSIDGLINEYRNLCPAIENGEKVLVQPLNDLETIQIDGSNYEAFNTSGGLGNFIDNCIGKVNSLNYKTIRYPGHQEKMKFLFQDLHLNKKPEILKELLEEFLPKTKQDVVIIYISVSGYQHNTLNHLYYVHKFYPKVIDNREYTAIQLVTASTTCALVDLILRNSSHYSNLVTLDRFTLKDILDNFFGRWLF